MPGGTSLLETLKGAGPLTVFAPNNGAFADITAPTDPAALGYVLLHHVLDKSVESSAIPDRADSLLKNRWDHGVTLLFATNGTATVNGAEVVAADIKCTNGIVHVVDEVLLPPNVVSMAGIAGLSSLVGAVTAAADLPGGSSIAQALSADEPYTVFAPTNSAFAAITVPTDPIAVRDILLLHVVNAGTPLRSPALPAMVEPLLAGEELSFNTNRSTVSSDGTDDAAILMTDINVTNGVIHVIDKVLLP
jgi:transforming growth factor-beta-induced protein